MSDSTNIKFEKSDLGNSAPQEISQSKTQLTAIKNDKINADDLTPESQELVVFRKPEISTLESDINLPNGDTIKKGSSFDSTGIHSRKRKLEAGEEISSVKKQKLIEENRSIGPKRKRMDEETIGYNKRRKLQQEIVDLQEEQIDAQKKLYTSGTKRRIFSDVQESKKRRLTTAIGDEKSDLEKQN